MTVKVEAKTPSKSKKAPAKATVEESPATRRSTRSKTPTK